MRITTKSKIALNAMLDIAAHTAKGYAISLPIVSKRLGISHSYLELIFSSLKAAGLIHSHRGPGGGYSLAKNPEAISVKDIVDATSNARPLVGDLSGQLWANLDAHMQSQMSQILLGQILAGTTICIEPEQLHLRLGKTQAPRTTKVPALALPKVHQALGPNSVFGFGQYLLRKNQ